MKTILLSVLSLIAFNLSAQTETENNTEVVIEKSEEPVDTTRFRVGETEFIIINHGDEKSDTLLADNF